MSENNDYIQLPPLKKDTPADVVAFMWEYMKVPEDSREKVKNLLKDANENGVKISHQAPTLYDVVPKEEIAEFEELMRKTIADIVSEASSVRCLLGVCAEICEAQNPKRNAARIARRKSIHPGYDEISEELLHSARAIIEADNEMQRIKDKIGMFHEI